MDDDKRWNANIDDEPPLTIGDLDDREIAALDELCDWTDAECEELDREAFDFSPEFEAKMDQLFKDHQIKELKRENEQLKKMTRITVNRRLAKWAGVAACLLLAVGVMQMSSSAGVKGIFQFFTNAYDKYVVGSSVEVTLEEVGPDVNGELTKTYPNIFVLTKLPSGFEVSEYAGDRSNLQLIYSDGTNEILFRQKIGTDTLGDNTEAELIETLESNGVEYNYLRKKENGIIERTLDWEIGDTYFRLMAPIGKEELLEIAESIKFVK